MTVVIEKPVPVVIVPKKTKTQRFSPRKKVIAKDVLEIKTVRMVLCWKMNILTRQGLKAVM
jgi:hypothetical protein